MTWNRCATSSATRASSRSASTPTSPTSSHFSEGFPLDARATGRARTTTCRPTSPRRTQAELDYLAMQHIGRLATVSPDGQARHDGFFPVNLEHPDIVTTWWVAELPLDIERIR